MTFSEYINSWVKAELTQGKIMIGIDELLRGAMIPLALLVLVLIGYGAYILTSRPAHAKTSIALYEKSKTEGIQKEIEKHINDNKTGKTLTKFVYPGLIIVSAIALLLLVSLYYKGMAVGCIILFASTYFMDSGFVSRSDAFISFLNKL